MTVRAARAALAMVVLLVAGAGAQAPQDDDLPLLEAAMDEAAARCAEDAASVACVLASERRAALMADAIAEAGQSRDRGLLMDRMRQLLAAPDPQVRAAALYAMAKMAPDAADTTALRALVQDAYSLVRAGAWSAAKASSDGAANAIAARSGGRRITGGSVQPDAAFYDPATLEAALPGDAAYLAIDSWLTTEGQLVFVTPQTPEDVAAHFAGQAGGEARPLTEIMAWSPEIATGLERYGKAALFENAVVVPLADGTGAHAGKPVRLAVVYRDVALATTGFALVWIPRSNLTPPPAPEKAPELLPLDDRAGFIADLKSAAGIKEGAPRDDTALWLSVKAAGGYGAAIYLELFPDGAYRVEAEALLAVPEIRLDSLAYREGSDASLSFRNLPADLNGEIHLIGSADGVDRNLGPIQVRAGAVPAMSLRGLTPDLYRVRLLATEAGGGAYFAASTELRIAPDEAVLSLKQTSYPPNTRIVVAFSEMRGDAKDFVAIARPGAPTEYFPANYPSHAFTGGAKSGEAVLKTPAEAGDYEVRAYFATDGGILRASAPFTVASDAPAPAPVAAAPGAPVITLTKPVFAVNEPIIFSVSGLPGKKQDWVSVAATSMNDGQWSVYDYTKGVTEGSFTLRGQPAGQYEVRVYFQTSPDVQARAPFSVE